MAKSPLDTTTLKVHVFAREEFQQLVADLYTNGLKVHANEDLVGALVLAARRAAIGEVKAAVSRYWERTATIESSLGHSPPSEGHEE
jgi:hypothetical protein